MESFIQSFILVEKTTINIRPTYAIKSFQFKKYLLDYVFRTYQTNLDFESLFTMLQNGLTLNQKDVEVQIKLKIFTKNSKLNTFQFEDF